MDAEELTLWAGRPATRNALYDRYANTIEQTIWRAMGHMGLPSYCDFDGLRSAGLVGALQALDTFDPSRNIQFQTFAFMRIRGAILDALRKSDISRSVRRLVTQRLSAEQTLLEQLQRDPTQEEVCQLLGWDTRTYLLSTTKAQRALSSVIARSKYEGREKTDPATWRPIQSNDLVFVPEGVDAESTFRELCRGLTIQEQTIVYLHYWCGSPMRLVGQAMGLSESRISQMHTKLIERLRERGNEHFASAMSA